jgi:hypothetical protein
VSEHATSLIPMLYSLATTSTSDVWWGRVEIAGAGDRKIVAFTETDQSGTASATKA